MAVMLCGVVAVVVKHPPRALVKGSVRTAIGFGWISTGLHGVAAGGVVATLTLFFLKAGAFVGPLGSARLGGPRFAVNPTE